MKRDKSIIYVNYSPYENSGKILDFLRENFTYVLAFSLGFHLLKNKKNYNSLTVYKNGKVQREYFFFRLPMSERLVFLLLPVRSVLTFFQIIVISAMLKIKFGTIDTYFSVNAFTAWIGNVLRSMGIVKKTTFWVWDYYPPIHESKIITLMRAVYWQFDKWAAASNEMVFVNQRLIDLRKVMGLIPQGTQYPVIPIGTDVIKSHAMRAKSTQLVFGFIGVLKKSHGLGIVFDHAAEIIKEFPGAGYEIVGSGPDEEYFKQQALRSPINTHFYGYMEGETFNEVLRKCTIGIATYIPDPSNVSPFGDPGKIKRYLSLGIPVIATDVIEFASDIKKTGVGEIISYNNKREFIQAVQKILSDYPRYQKNALKLSDRFYYRKIYPKFFR